MSGDVVAFCLKMDDSNPSGSAVLGAETPPGPAPAVPVVQRVGGHPENPGGVGAVPGRWVLLSRGCSM